jgi:hypothetical protein
MIVVIGYYYCPGIVGNRIFRSRAASESGDSFPVPCRDFFSSAAQKLCLAWLGLGRSDLRFRLSLGFSILAGAWLGRSFPRV